MSSETLNSIHPIVEYTVSETSLSAYLEELGLTEDNISKMSLNSVIVDVGSGKLQGFAKRVSELRPDIKVVSIDPTMALDPTRKDVGFGFDGDKYYYYVGSNSHERRETSDYASMHGERIKNAQPGTIAAEVPIIPLSTGCAHLLVDRLGPVLYLREKKEFLEYINEIVRVLRVGGEARLFPVGCLETNTYTLGNQWEEEARAELEKILPRVGGVTYEYFYNMQGVGLVVRLEDQSE